MKDKRKYWLWLSHMAGAGSKTAVNLVREFGGAEAVYKASQKELEKSGLVSNKKVLSRLVYKDLSEVEAILDWCDKNGVRVMVPTDKEYPKSLLTLRDAPMVLYCLGELPDFENTLSCAVVGTREMSEYGKNTAYQLGAGLADCGACIVSGLALGVDGMAMAGAVEAGGATVAVLGCGIDIVYPKQHETLLRKVLEKGAVITEYAPGVSPSGHNFPVRNRIISGISQAVCVVEGSMRSGSLITARHAVYQGKTLYAVPGRIGDKGSEGTNYLIKEGASAITGARDILSDFEFVYPHSIIMDGAVPHVSSDEAAEKLNIGSKGKKAIKEEKKAEREAKKQQKKEAKKKQEMPFPEEEKPQRRVDIDTLDETERRIFDYMKPDVPMLCEEIAEGGFELSQVMVSLTLLEIAGAVEAGAGGYYLKRAADFGGEPDYITEDDDGL